MDEEEFDNTETQATSDSPGKAAAPPEVEVQAVPKGTEGALELSLLITGIGGEKYRWSPKSRDAPRAGFEIVDASVKQVASGFFEYG